MKMVQFISEPNLWKVIKKEDHDQEKETGIEEIYALVLVYVDDIFMVGEEDVLTSMMTTIQEEWKTSVPEWVGGDPVRFLGMEISRKEDFWMATQRNYVQDLLKRNLGDDERLWPKRKIPFGKEPPKEIEEPSADKVRTAQRVVGELQWLVTRTRPDLMYPVSRLSSMTLSGPTWVVEAAHQVWGYLAATWEEGIGYGGRKEAEEWEEGSGIEAYADASFAPQGEESHGAVIVALRGGPLLWKCGRQTTVALSTAESELNELIEGLMVGESVAAVVQELEPQVSKVMVTDSQAAVGICTSEGGSWRTRHLRLRAAHARQRFTRGDWWLKHKAGEEMLADIGTKPLQSTRLSYLKKGLQMKTFEEQKNEECDTTEEGGETVRSRQEEIEKVLKMLVLVASIQGVGAQGEEEQRGEGMLVVAVVLVFAVVGFIGVLVECWKRMRGLMRSEEPEEEPQDLPETPVEPEQTSPAFQANPLEEPRVERRSPVPRSPGSVSERRQRSEREERSQEEVQALRTPVRTSERMQTPRSPERVPTPGSSERFPMLRTPRSEEVQTPRTISSDVQLTSVRFTPRGCQTGASRSANGSQRSSGFLDDLMESFNHRDDGY